MKKKSEKNKYSDVLCLLDDLETQKNEKKNNIQTTINNISKLATFTKENTDEYIKNIDELYDLQYNDISTPPFQKNIVFDPNVYRDDILNEKIVFKIASLYNNKKSYNQFDTPLHLQPVEKLVKIEKIKKNIDVEVNKIEDLLKLINDYPLDDALEYNINMDSLHKIKIPLEEMNNMVGMKGLKENIVDQILYFIQDLHKSGGKNNGDFMHTVIYGPPGTGKTEMAKIIGNIYGKLGILTKGTFKKVTRSDLVAGYLGQTAIKTRDVIAECLGGVLFIDEAYALGNTEKKDIFSKECIDTLCEALSNHKDNLMVIIAGYEKELNECFFSYNQGLDSRFTWRFKTDEYNGKELYAIFEKKILECNWSIETDAKIKPEWFEKNVVYFKFFGRDIETLLSKIKIAHSRRVFCKPIEFKTKITLKDLEKGFEMFLKNEDVKKRRETDSINKMVYSLYV